MSRSRWRHSRWEKLAATGPRVDSRNSSTKRRAKRSDGGRSRPSPNSAAVGGYSEYGGETDGQSVIYRLEAIRGRMNGAWVRGNTDRIFSIRYPRLQSPSADTG